MSKNRSTAVLELERQLELHREENVHHCRILGGVLQLRHKTDRKNGWKLVYVPSQRCPELFEEGSLAIFDLTADESLCCPTFVGRADAVHARVHAAATSGSREILNLRDLLFRFSSAYRLAHVGEAA